MLHARLRAAAGNRGGIPTDGLVAHYTMDNLSGSTLVDESGFGNDGTVTGAVQAAGVVGQALSFDGTDDRVDTPHSASLNIGGLSSSYALSLWFVSSAGGINQRITAKYDATASGGTDPLPLFINIQTNGEVLFGFRDTDGTFRWIKTAGAYNDGVFHHLIAERNHSTGQFLLRIDDNEEVSTTGVIDASMENGAAITIGYFNDNGTRRGFLNGKVDQYRLYSRVLSSAEKTALYGES